MKKIVLIEDNDDLRENTAEILTLAGFEVLTAPDGKAGVELALSQKPDLVICDILMPVLDGHGVLHLLSRNPETAAIPFIFLTAKAERSDFRKGMEMGADDYLTKPFDDIELLNAIETRLRKATQRNNTGSSQETIAELINQFPTQEFSRKSFVFREAQHPKGVYYIHSGKVKCSQANEQGKELITAIYDAGEFFGITDLLQTGPYTTSAIAMEKSVICLIPTEQFLSAIFANRELTRQLFKEMSGDVKSREERLLKLAYDSVRKRIAQALAELAEKTGGNSGEPVPIVISREDLSHLAGTATETVIRTLSDFKDEGLIGLSGSKITVFQPEKLWKMRN